jgi:hypothetical protein
MIECVEYEDERPMSQNSHFAVVHGTTVENNITTFQRGSNHFPSVCFPFSFHSEITMPLRLLSLSKKGKWHGGNVCYWFIIAVII